MFGLWAETLRFGMRLGLWLDVWLAMRLALTITAFALAGFSREFALLWHAGFYGPKLGLCEDLSCEPRIRHFGLTVRPLVILLTHVANRQHEHLRGRKNGR